MKPPIALSFWKFIEIKSILLEIGCSGLICFVGFVMFRSVFVAMTQQKRIQCVHVCETSHLYGRLELFTIVFV